MITQERLKELLSYDQDAGLFTWLVARSRTKKGATAGCMNAVGYLMIGMDNTVYYAHRLAWLYVHGEFPARQIDHINGVRTHNSIANLRSVTHAENGKNKKLPSTNTSGVVGVVWRKNKGKWVANIKVDGKKIHLGSFEKKGNAILARKKAELDHGFHENHGRTN
jgi:hypothetical protein